MKAEEAGLLEGAPAVVERIVEVDGIPMSARCAEVDRPRAVVVAVHGGATTARYFDPPGLPRLSLLRLGARLDFTVLALDRPGYGASEPYGDAFDAPDRRADATYRTIDALLGAKPRGAGVFLMAHSAGCDLAVNMAVDPRGSSLLGVELAGTGRRKHPEALRRIDEVRRTRRSTAVRDLLWQPEAVYPPEIVGGRAVSSASPPYESTVVREWPADFPRLAPRIQVPVRFSYAEYEQVWRCDPEALAEITGFFTACPRFVTYRQPDTGHNISVSYAAESYHRSVFSFVEDCVRGGPPGDRRAEEPTS
ncbi:alpha/beta fold hydrolase [Nocardia carnea]|uniref:alpha/beta fold hydrolase n=1 Tax=Nocardia carnea TaxID=37328 RepID=UPI002458C6F6|nr:alpha/beta fold hydrolase [Nocardia carnea]